ncbi:MAG: NADH-quinone oxidoreductase subunit J [Gammaproteobacteria bacterium]|nr:NADH-quinone oxidoreductase subunit J [Gammaproteobacteria bacterium]
MLLEIIFYTFASILICASLGVILFKNPVYSAVSLILAFITTGMLWLLLEAEFLAIVLVLVYVGAVMVLFLFVIMMLNIHQEEERSGFTKIAPIAIFLGLVIAAELIALYWIQSDQFSGLESISNSSLSVDNTLLLGTELFTKYILSFEIAGFILLLAIIVSISLTLRTRKNVKKQIASDQIAADPKQRVRMVDIKRGGN